MEAIFFGPSLIGLNPKMFIVPEIIPPEKWGTNPFKQRKRVDFPLPVLPMTILRVPGSRSRLISFKTGLEDGGYWNDSELRLIMRNPSYWEGC
jgi:hypothetical protein